jgi:DNA-binding winged helix-turn-helix (wHTH) protein
MVYGFADFELDDQLYQLRRSGETVKVEPQVFKLLAYLIVHRNRVISREELFEKLWPGQVVSEAALTYCIAKARKAVQDDGIQQHVINTQHGHGYRFVATITVQVDSSPQNKQSISIAEDRILPVQRVPRTSWSTRRLLFVGLFLVLGWIASLWQLHFQPSATSDVLFTLRREAFREVTQVEGKLCSWWIPATNNQPALDSLLRGWDYYSLPNPVEKKEK